MKTPHQTAELNDFMKHLTRVRTCQALSVDQIRLIEIAIGLSGDEAMLATRALGGGPDPASLEYLSTGKVSTLVARAHQLGPGVFEGKNLDQRNHYLGLCALSADESQERTVRDNLLSFAEALDTLWSEDVEEFEMGAQVELQKITALPFRVVDVLGTPTRLYRSDRGFAAAYWSGERHAAVAGVFQGKPYLAVGTVADTTLAQVFSIQPGKRISPQFGIVEEPDLVAACLAQLED